MMVQIKRLIGAALVAVSISLAGMAQAADPGATAEIKDTEGKMIGEAHFTQSDKGVKVKVNLKGFETNPGSLHGLHLHAVGKCTPTFKAAGGHFNPLDKEHGFLSPKGPHAGDMPMIWVEDDGSAQYSYTTDLITLNEGERALLDDDGAAVVIHARDDDYLAGSAGNGGDRSACGVIQKSAE